ncbi:hypothetical protein SFRURICE_005955, partial [Spodoptera frugiperda]
RLRDVAASAHAIHDEESLCDSKLVELFSINVRGKVIQCLLSLWAMLEAVDMNDYLGSRNDLNKKILLEEKKKKTIVSTSLAEAK